MPMKLLVIGSVGRNFFVVNVGGEPPQLPVLLSVNVVGGLVTEAADRLVDDSHLSGAHPSGDPVIRARHQQCTLVVNHTARFDESIGARVIDPDGAVLSGAGQWNKESEVVQANKRSWFGLGLKEWTAND